MIPEALREPNLFDHTLEESTFSYDKNRQVKVHSTIAAEAKSNREAEIVRNRTAEDSPKTPDTESTADTSPFYTPDSEKQSSTSHTPQSSPKSVQNEHNITELPTTSNKPVSNLAKLLNEKRYEHELAKQQTANTAPTVETHTTTTKTNNIKFPPSSTNSLAIRSRTLANAAFPILIIFAFP